MFTKTELFVCFFSGSILVSGSVVGTLNAAGLFDEPAIEARETVSGYRYELPEAFHQCRQHAEKNLAFPIKNILMDSRSSHYDNEKNIHKVYFDVQTAASEGSYRQMKYDTLVVCDVSASNNEVLEFRYHKKAWA